MLGVLIKKHIAELFSYYFYNAKKGKIRSVGGIIGFSVIMILAYISVMFAFFSMSQMLAIKILAEDVINSDSTWLYYSIMGLFAMILGVFGSVFNTYASLYKAKDNDFLLSLPIRPVYILITRMTGVFVTSLLYSSLAWIPTVIAYFFYVDFTVKALIYSIILLFLITIFVTVLTCALGWVVAVVSSKLKNKSFITVLISLVFFGIYYAFCMKADSFFEGIAGAREEIAGTIKSGFFPIYHLGKAATGNTVSLIIFAAISIILFIICCYVLSKSFINLVTKSTGTKKVEYKEKKLKENSVLGALFKKELSRFISSPTYMLNSGLGLVMLPVITVLIIIKSGALYEMVAEMPEIGSLFPLIIVALYMMIITLNLISFPSVSLEGGTLWILHSLPVDGKTVLRAKELLHIVLNIVPAVICLVVSGIYFGFGILDLISGIILLVAFIWFSSAFGLMIGLIKPMLEWNNEAIPIKQNLSIFIPMIAGWLLGAGAAIGGIFLTMITYPFIGILAMAALFALITLPVQIYLNEKGAERFEKL